MVKFTSNSNSETMHVSRIVCDFKIRDILVLKPFWEIHCYSNIRNYTFCRAVKILHADLFNFV